MESHVPNDPQLPDPYESPAWQRRRRWLRIAGFVGLAAMGVEMLRTITGDPQWLPGRVSQVLSMVCIGTAAVGLIVGYAGTQIVNSLAHDAKVQRDFERNGEIPHAPPPRIEPGASRRDPTDWHGYHNGL